MKFPTRTLNLFLTWILFSLLAIAYIGQRPFLGLAIAIIGGIVLGVLSFLYYETPSDTGSNASAPSGKDLSPAEEEVHPSADSLKNEVQHDEVRSDSEAIANRHSR